MQATTSQCRSRRLLVYTCTCTNNTAYKYMWLYTCTNSTAHKSICGYIHVAYTCTNNTAYKYMLLYLVKIVY